MLAARGIGLDGIAGDIEVSRLVTPADWAADGLAAGTPFSLAHTLAQTGPFRPRNLVPGLDNAVLPGCGTTPGVGIPPVLISGRLAAQRITGGSRTGRGCRRRLTARRGSIGRRHDRQPSSPVDEPATPERCRAVRPGASAAAVGLDRTGPDGTARTPRAAGSATPRAARC